MSDDDQDMSRVIRMATEADGEQICRTIDDAVGCYGEPITEAVETLRIHDERTVAITLALLQLKALDNLSNQLVELLQSLPESGRR